MIDKPIIFSAPMVRAIIREIEHPGTGKTQTRRIIKFQDDGCFTGDCPHETQAECDAYRLRIFGRYKPGMLLWVRRRAHVGPRPPPRRRPERPLLEWRSV